jgi:hypothetical protein
MMGASMVRYAYQRLSLYLDYVRGVNVFERIARWSLWLLLLLHMRVCMEAMSVFKEILVLKTGET